MQNTNDLSISDRLVEIEARALRQDRTIIRLRRRLTAVTIVFASILMFSLVAGAISSDVLIARKLVLKDRDGHDRIRVDGDDSRGYTAIELLDRTGRRCFSIGVGPTKVAGMSFNDIQGVPRLTLGLGPNGTPGVVLSDAQLSIRYNVRLDESGKVVIINKQDGEKK